MKRLMLSILLMLNCSAQARTIWVLIHGTWGVDSAWYLPGGDFFQQCKESIQLYDNQYCISFTWSGKNCHDARLRGAQQLCALLQSYSPKTTFLLVAHSHGANVAFLASQLLAEQATHKIETIFALGAPINTEWYAPNMEIVANVFNFFSLRDLVQPVFGMFERQITNHERIANIRVLVDDKQPMHSGLHAPEIGKWLPHLQTQHRQITLEGERFDMSIPMLMKFTMESYPVSEVDVNRRVLIEKDYENQNETIINYSGSEV